jgi:hypothetical protein
MHSDEPYFIISLYSWVFLWRHRSGRGSTLKQNTVTRVSRLFVLCISLVFGGKYVAFCIIFSLQYSINIDTFEVDPPSDSLHYAVVKPNNIYSVQYINFHLIISVPDSSTIIQLSEIGTKCWYLSTNVFCHWMTVQYSPLKGALHSHFLVEKPP